MSFVGGLIAEVLYELGLKAEKHRRKRAPGDEDHWYPGDPERHGLVPDQCKWCKRVLPGKPKRGCDANVNPSE